MVRHINLEHGDTTIDQLVSSAVRKCARGDIAPQETVILFRYGEGMVQGKRYRGLVKMDFSVQILHESL